MQVGFAHRSYLLKVSKASVVQLHVEWAGEEGTQTLLMSQKFD